MQGGRYKHGRKSKYPPNLSVSSKLVPGDSTTFAAAFNGTSYGQDPRSVHIAQIICHHGVYGAYIQRHCRGGGRQ